MTRKEAIEILKKAKHHDMTIFDMDYYYEALDTAIAALKAEPSENAVSLSAVIDTIEWYRTNPQHFTEDNLIEDIKGLPLVTPARKKGIEEENRTQGLIKILNRIKEQKDLYPDVITDEKIMSINRVIDDLGG